MARHIADQDRGRSGERTRRFAELERRHAVEGTHPAVKAVVARSVTGSTGRRLVEFIRIARGRTA